MDIKNNLISLSYEINKFNYEINLSLILQNNLIYIENINNKKKMFLPFDKNIKFNTCQIKNDLLNIDLSSNVIFEN